MTAKILFMQIRIILIAQAKNLRRRERLERYLLGSDLFGCTDVLIEILGKLQIPFNKKMFWTA